MPLFVDATALVALGYVDGICWLQHIDSDVVVPSRVWIEARRWRDQLEDGQAQGWLRIETASATEVEELQRYSDLHGGEAETIVLAGHSAHVQRANTRVLIDENSAFFYVQRIIRGRPRLNFELLYLARVLHQLEDHRHIDSASQVMAILTQSENYKWASNVRLAYEQWCTQTGVTPIP